MAKKGRSYRRIREGAGAQAAAAAEHKIRAWREWFDWSQEMLSEKSGISVSAISAYERGADNPSLDALRKLGMAFGVPRGMLLDVDPNDDPPLWTSVLRATTTSRSPIVSAAVRQRAKT